MGDLRSRFFIPFGLFEKEITNNKEFTSLYCFWNYILDYHQLKLEGLGAYTAAHAQMEGYLSNRFNSYKSENPSLPTLKVYGRQREEIKNDVMVAECTR